MAVSSLVLKQFALFATWPEAAVEVLSQHLVLRSLARRQLALADRELGDSVAWVLEGSVWLMDHSLDEREVFLDRFAPGTLFGELHAFGSGDATLSGLAYVAAGQASVAVTKKSVLWSLMGEFPAVGQAMVRLMAARMGAFFRWRSIISLPSAPERVAAVLMALADDAAGNLPGGITQQEIAAYANTTRETVTRAMQRFQTSGAVVREGSTWRVNRTELAVLAQG